MDKSGIIGILNTGYFLIKESDWKGRENVKKEII
jgi:hypothetical protein